MSNSENPMCKIIVLVDYFYWLLDLGRGKSKTGFKIINYNYFCFTFSLGNFFFSEPVKQQQKKKNSFIAFCVSKKNFLKIAKVTFGNIIF